MVGFTDGVVYGTDGKSTLDLGQTMPCVEFRQAVTLGVEPNRVDGFGHVLLLGIDASGVKVVGPALTPGVL